MKKSCIDCRLKIALKIVLDAIDGMFPNAKMSPEALEEKKQLRQLILDRFHRIAELNKTEREE